MKNWPMPLIRFLSRAQFTPLYADWKYFSLRARGLTSVGPSTPYGGFSLSWKRSLFSDYSKTLKKTRIRPQSALDVLSKSYVENVAVEGYLTLFEKPRIEYPEIKKLPCPPCEDMEGEIWEPCALTEKLEDRIDQIRAGDYLLVYLNKNGYLFPRTLWPRIRCKIRFVGEVYPAHFQNSLYRKCFFLKARAAGFFLKR